MHWHPLSLAFMRGSLFVISAVLCTQLVFGQHVALETSSKFYPVEYPEYLEDRKGSMQFAEVLARQHQFKASSLPVPDFVGNFSRAIWYRFTVTNRTAETTWYLEVKGGHLHQITLYQPFNNTQIDSLSLFADTAPAARPVHSNSLIFPVALEPGETRTLYVRATSKALIRVSMSMNTMQTLYEKSVYSSYGDGFFTALAVALLLYNLFVYFSLRERVYLYYIGYIFTTILHTNLVAGHLILFLPELDFLNTNLLLPVLAAFSVLFTNSFLQTRQYAPLIHRVRWFITGCFLAPVILYFLGEYAAAILASTILMFMLFTYWITAGIIAYRNGFQPAIYYLIGFSALVTMNLVFELKILGVVKEGYWIDSSLYIGSALEAIILSFALASKINFYKKEKEDVQQLAYEQAVNFSRDLIHTQEHERKRIASELHDSVGQKLILIKNKVLRFTKTGSAGFQQNPEGLADNVSDVIQEIRSISYGLRPYQIDLLGLTQSIRSLVGDSFEAANLPYTIQVEDIDSITDPDMQINVYRIIQEAVNNLIKHAAATMASVSVTIQQQQQLLISITDNGLGFDSNTRTTGFGLTGMKERLQIMNGQLTIESEEGKGTSIHIRIPMN